MTEIIAQRTSHKTKALSIVIALVLLVGCDRVTKTIAQHKLQDAPSRSYLMETVRLQYAENEGALLGLGSELPKWFRLGFSFILFVIAVAALVALLVKVQDLRPCQLCAFTLMLAGGFGNLHDRLLNDGRVIDFVIIVVGPLRTGIFNVADVCITCGVIVMLLDAVIRRKPAIESEAAAQS
jgi:signal peptidase II